MICTVWRLVMWDTVNKLRVMGAGWA